ncbi:MAG: DUF1549 domain-containing protein [Planctomycetes bacterium]|jgi:hypothetical protein|nr:DUF1549 domain-containing protein [Planctomycetota bacterium]MCL4730006.1 DUF1549 domain-containing protein [Planctomycetota bacterium]
MRQWLAAAFLVCGVGCWLTGRAAADEVKPAAPETARPALRSSAELTALIDAEIAKVWARDGITPAAPSSDHVFLRRVYLDTLGVPPTVAEAEAFLADKSDNRRAALIDRLLADERFGRHMADLWMSAWMRRDAGKDGMDVFFGQWLAEQFNTDRGLDRIIYDIITAGGALHDNPATAYYAQHRDLVTADVAGNATRHFTGVQIQCAQCHDHPYEEHWKVADFNGVASFFAGLRVKNNGDRRPRFGEVVDVKTEPMDEARLKRKLAGLNEEQRKELLEKMRYRQPKFLLGERVNIEDGTLWRPAWARWVISRDNAQTRRYLANRVWSFAFGSGLHNPVDDYNSFNTPSHPELLDALALDLRDSGYSVKRLYRAILNSRVWQLAAHGARASENGRVETWHFAQFAVRRLSPEQFFGALMTVTPAGEGMRKTPARKDNPYSRMIAEGERFEQRKADGQLGENERKLVYDFAALRKLESMYEAVAPDWMARRRMAAGFARSTTDDEMTESDGFSLTIDQALFVMNSDATNRISDFDRGGLMGKVLAGARDDDARVRVLYLAVLSRAPTGAERARVLAHARNNDGWEDVFYALLMTTEFATNH